MKTKVILFWLVMLFFILLLPHKHDFAIANPQQSCFGSVSSAGGTIRAQRPNDVLKIIGSIANPFLKTVSSGLIVPKNTPAIPKKWFRSYTSGSFGISQPTVDDISGFDNYTSNVIVLLAAKVPYSGAVNDVDLGSHTVTSSATTGFLGNATTATGLSSTLATGSGGTGTSTTFTQGSVVYAGASGIYTQDANNFFYNPTGYASHPNFELGGRASNPIDAGFEFYVPSGVTAHFHNVNTVQSSTGGVTVGLMYVPAGAAVTSGNRVGSLEFGGSINTGDDVGTVAAIRAFPTENLSAGHQGGKLTLCTTPNASSTCTTALTLDQNQSVIFAGTTSGLSASDITTGTLPHAQLPTLLSGDIPNNAANTTGSAAKLAAAATGSTLTLTNAYSVLNTILKVVSDTGNYVTGQQVCVDYGTYTTFNAGRMCAYVENNSTGASGLRFYTIPNTTTYNSTPAVALGSDNTTTLNGGTNTVYRCTGITNTGLLTINNALCTTGYSTTSLRLD